MKLKSNIREEAQAFDKQISERVKHGHIPDLRRAKFCGYFYNSSWRDPAYVKLDFGEQFELINKSIRRYAPKQKNITRVLEVGCGPGHISLELARAGYYVTGIDVSQKCVKIARQFSDSDPWKNRRGALEYIQGDFMDSRCLDSRKYDGIVFLGSLHHFKNQSKIMKRAKESLVKKGIIIVHEPTRDRITEGNVAFIHLLQSLLSVAGGYYRKVKIHSDIEERKIEIRKIWLRLKYENSKGYKVQSVNDNEAGFRSMYSALKKNFKQIIFLERYAFFHEVIGGLRFDKATNIALAKYLRDIDHHLCNLGVLQSTEFFFVGKNT